MKFSTLYKKILEASEEEIAAAQQAKVAQQEPVKKEVPEPNQEVDPLRSNIDQFWMNPEDMKNDLTKFLTKTQGEDPELARFLISGIRQVLGQFRYKPEQPTQ